MGKDTKSATPAPPPPKYQMTISRLTVDKLGVKLYDRVSAVIAEIVAIRAGRIPFCPQSTKMNARLANVVST